jgi:uncharacterized MnhB-related membrane protein
VLQSVIIVKFFPEGSSQIKTQSKLLQRIIIGSVLQFVLALLEHMLLMVDYSFKSAVLGKNLLLNICSKIQNLCGYTYKHWCHLLLYYWIGKQVVLIHGGSRFGCSLHFANNWPKSSVLAWSLQPVRNFKIFSTLPFWFYFSIGLSVWMGAGTRGTNLGIRWSEAEVWKNFINEQSFVEDFKFFVLAIWK